MATRTSAGSEISTSRNRWRWTIGIAAVYVALSIAVMVGSPLDNLDQHVLHWNLDQRWPSLQPWLLGYVMIGQRGPATLVALPWIIWRSWRMRTPQPLIRLAVAFLVLNLSVGAVKTLIGRLGPQVTNHATAVFDGGNIYPSGHTSNAVVLFGVLAWMTVRNRRIAIAAAGFLAFTVGISTIYLDTHWVTDVLGGWLAGALVLLVLPTLVPIAERWTEKSLVALRRVPSAWRERVRRVRRPVAVPSYIGLPSPVSGPYERPRVRRNAAVARPAGSPGGFSGSRHPTPSRAAGRRTVVGRIGAAVQPSGGRALDRNGRWVPAAVRGKAASSRP